MSARAAGFISGLSSGQIFWTALVRHFRRCRYFLRIFIHVRAAHRYFSPISIHALTTHEYFSPIFIHAHAGNRYFFRISIHARGGDVYFLCTLSAPIDTFCGFLYIPAGRGALRRRFGARVLAGCQGLPCQSNLDSGCVYSATVAGEPESEICLKMESGFSTD